jgi:hypothetical protein
MIEKFLIEQPHPCVWRVPVSGTISQYAFFILLIELVENIFSKNVWNIFKKKIPNK